ncbi:MAG: response regulator [Thalassotalea sp.]|nr:response regulator [Thalassotalea sp.]
MEQMTAISNQPELQQAAEHLIAPIKLLSISLTPSLDESKRLRTAISQLLSKFNVSTTVISQAQLALTEVLTNLIKHAECKASVIDLLVRKSGDHLCFQLRDNGSPFEGFTQHRENASKFTFAESGMGLGIVFQLFPHCQYKAKMNEPATVGGNSSDGISVRFNQFSFSIEAPEQVNKQVTVAIVEDEPMMRELVAAYLPDSYHIVSFENGQAFLQEHQGQVIDLVISDISMPVIDGLTLKKKLSENQSLAHVPFIFLTAQDDSDTEMLANSLGIDNYLTKPVNKQKLIMAVERALSRYQQLAKREKEMLTANLLPERLPELDNYQADYFTISPANTGGDFIYHRQMGDKTLIILADVMGHNVESTLFAHAFSGFFSGLIGTHKSISLSSLMTALSNQLLTDPVLSKTLITCVGAVVSSEHIELVCAGHPAPILFSSSYSQEHSKYSVDWQTLELKGALPGVVQDTDYQTHRLLLQDNERLLLCTDGFFDACTAREQRDVLLTRVGQELCIKGSTGDGHSGSLEEGIQRVENIFTELCSDVEDDVTVLVIQNKEKTLRKS